MLKEVVDTPALKTSKVRLDGILSSVIWLKISLPVAGGLDQMNVPLRVPSNTNYFMSL